MKAIPITQFLRPNGEKRPLVCDVSDDVASLYEQVIAPLGVRITAECLQHSSFVSLCLEDPAARARRLAPLRQTGYRLVLRVGLSVAMERKVT